jgi:hypothetical protein
MARAWLYNFWANERRLMRFGRLVIVSILRHRGADHLAGKLSRNPPSVFHAVWPPTPNFARIDARKCECNVVPMPAGLASDITE